jgi:hypothetical protein
MQTLPGEACWLVDLQLKTELNKIQIFIVAFPSLPDAMVTHANDWSNFLKQNSSDKTSKARRVKINDSKSEKRKGAYLTEWNGILKTVFC